MGFPKSFKTIEIEQQTQFGFTPEYVQRLCEEWSVIKDYAWILHDKDVKADGTPKEEHIHLMLRFKDSVPTDAILAKLKGVCEVQQLEKMKKWNSALAYLCHKNAPDKHLYEDAEVHSNFDWLADAEKAISGNVRLSVILKQIEDGTIKQFNIHDYVTIDEYTTWKRKIDNGFAYRLEKIKGANREMDCIFITGDSGVGKTTLAKEMCEDRGYSVYVSSASNDVVDDYKGQDAIILDDLRPSSLGLSDLLKMLDNNTASSVKSRFRNKVLECKLIIITSTLPIDKFFSQVFESENETKIQLMRRCESYITMTKDKIIYRMWNKASREYDVFPAVDNLITLRYKAEELTPEQKLEKVAQIFGQTSKFAQALSDAVKNGSIIPDCFASADDIKF